LIVDDCWAGPRNATGYLTPEADHFPNGMKVCFIVELLCFCLSTFSIQFFYLFFYN
jgi:alpha-galactosidase